MTFKKGDLVYRQFPKYFDGNKWLYDNDGPFKVMGEIDGYLMVRRPRCTPIVLYAKNALRDQDLP